MGSFVIRQGPTTHVVNAAEHAANLRRLRELPSRLGEIPRLSKNFTGKPQFVIRQEGNAAGNFFSRLVNSRLYLDDPERLGNLFIEEASGTRIFRFLDLERVSFQSVYSDPMKAKMLARFIRSAQEKGFLTPERLGEFIIVASGGRERVAYLVEGLLAQPGMIL